MKEIKNGCASPKLTTPEHQRPAKRMWYSRSFKAGRSEPGKEKAKTSNGSPKVFVSCPIRWSALWIGRKANRLTSIVNWENSSEWD